MARRPVSMIQRMPAWAPVRCVLVATGESCEAMQMPEPFAFSLPDVARVDEKGVRHVDVRGGSVRGGAGDWLVRRADGCFLVMPSRDVVSASVVEAARAG